MGRPQWSTRMRNAGIEEHRHHRHELVVLDLNIDEHVERDELLQERLRIAVIIDAVVRDVPRNADDTLRP